MCRRAAVEDFRKIEPQQTKETVEKLLHPTEILNKNWHVGPRVRSG